MVLDLRLTKRGCRETTFFYARTPADWALTDLFRPNRWLIAIIGLTDSNRQFEFFRQTVEYLSPTGRRLLSNKQEPAFQQGASHLYCLFSPRLQKSTSFLKKNGKSPSGFHLFTKFALTMQVPSRHIQPSLCLNTLRPTSYFPHPTAFVIFPIIQTNLSVAGELVFLLPDDSLTHAFNPQSAGPSRSLASTTYTL